MHNLFNKRDLTNMKVENTQHEYAQSIYNNHIKQNKTVQEI